MSKAVARRQVQTTLQSMAGEARKAKDAWQRELKACHDKGLGGSRENTPASLTERFAHWSMARLMLHTAVSGLLYSGQNNRRVDRYVNDLIAGEHWPAEN